MKKNILLFICKIIFLPHYYFFRRIKLVKEDFAAWMIYHPQLQKKRKYDGFISLMIRFPEYRQ